MTKYLLGAAIAGAIALANVASAQELPRAEDVGSIEGIMKAYYEVVSGPAGVARQVARDKSLHHPDAQIILVRGEGLDGMARMTLDEFHGGGDNIPTSAFYEWEVAREVERHGNVVHVWSTYAIGSEDRSEISNHGVNSIQMVWDGARWWITSWIFDARRPAPPVPDEYLPE